MALGSAILILGLIVLMIYHPVFRVIMFIGAAVAALILLYLINH